MVKGISKQVIVVQSPDPALFEQAIFILKEGRPEVSDEMLLQQAGRLVREERSTGDKKQFLKNTVFTMLGAAITALFWLLSSIL